MRAKFCLNHLIRPSVHVEKEGVGNCLKCEPDEENKNCKDYFEITLTTANVE